MNVQDALAVLTIQPGHVTPADIKLAYRRAAAKYHPDHNPAGLEMMKLINVAYETLKNFEGEVAQDSRANDDYGEALNTALNAIMGLGFTIEICGVWLWVSGNTRPHREKLKAAGYRWSPKKTCWYFRPAEHKSFNRTSWSMDRIRATYGSQAIKQVPRQLLGASC